MKKIGVMFGKERSFPEALIERINSKNIDGITAEPVKIDKVMQGESSGYAVIFDRISQDVPFYRAFLKNTALTGTAVINNPFWWSADEKFFNNALATKIGVPVPKTVILPSYAHPADTTDQSFSNLAYPLDWTGIFEYVGFPAYMKPFAGGGWKNVYRLDSLDEFYQKHGETGELVMLLQEEIQFDEYYRCYCIGGKHVRIMPYEPRNPHHLRYQASFSPTPERYKEMEDIVLKINQYLGYDFNTVELALRDGVPYAIDFCNPAPDADLASVGQENFDWVVETAANYAIERAQSQVDGKDNLTWGKFVKHGSAGKDLLDDGSSASLAPVINMGADNTAPLTSVPKAKKPAAKKAAPKKAAKPVAAETPATETEEIPFKDDAEAPNEGSDAAK
jgi:glutathione synthase/RimK-type ligase-like ATP-grasp enzyme